MSLRWQLCKFHYELSEHFSYRNSVCIHSSQLAVVKSSSVCSHHEDDSPCTFLGMSLSFGRFTVCRKRSTRTRWLKWIERPKSLPLHCELFLPPLPSSQCGLPEWLGHARARSVSSRPIIKCGTMMMPATDCRLKRWTGSIEAAVMPWDRGMSSSCCYPAFTPLWNIYIYSCDISTFSWMKFK